MAKHDAIANDGDAIANDGDAGSIDPTTLAPGTEQFDPSIHATRDGKPILTRTGSYRRKRGAGTRNQTQTSAPRSIPLDSFAGSLVLVHAALASATSIPELMINETEGKNLARAIADVQAFYGTILDPKTQAWINLAVVAGATYIPRIGMARMRMQMQKQNVVQEKSVEEQIQSGGNRFVYDYETPAPQASM